jgi:ABC-type multidrug transport system ATPase subunit
VISLRGVRYSYGPGSAALDCPSLDVGPGLTLVLGPNGAGKSTLLRLVAGIERPDAGTVAVAGHDLWRAEVAARAALAYVPEYPDFTPYATVEEVLRLVCRLRGRPPEEGEGALERVGLAELRRRSVRELSMGQRRRALLAAALVGDPRVVILDEPLESMDRATRALIVGWVERLRGDGRCVLVATHETAPFARLADRLLRVEEGRTRLLDPVPEEERARLG